ncbi:helix-turn-helix transcriptional regulator [Sphingomonas naphthae]|uniref:Helix-turn-helix transcriptional regulator n=1 Tax=Sphingomonas naphthae TaxID=1813468 RepID=A0ABY7TP40_9SPHN|nr:helix-turn-helix transcriptional regulator [Sphingomonas naphthae]WCT73964.1 helix-turn-helix transcriptional regulator [Sphingomonas naphthae]
MPDLSQMQARIAQVRAARKMTLDEVAKASGFTKAHIWELEKGRSRNPTVRAVWGLSRALGVSPAWLLGLDAEASAIDPLAIQIAALIDREIRSRDHILQEERG